MNISGLVFIDTSYKKITLKCCFKVKAKKS